MHFKLPGSSAVDELHKLTDYNSGHCVEDQLHFHFLLSLIPISTADVMQWEVGAKIRLRPRGFPTFLLLLLHPNLKLHPVFLLLLLLPLLLLHPQLHLAEKILPHSL